MWKVQKNYADVVASEVVKHGLDPERVVKEYGKISPKKVTINFGIGEHFYETSYGFMSGYAHERGFAFDYYYDGSDGKRLFMLGPVEKNPGIIFDIFFDLLRNLITALRIVEEPRLEEKALKIA